MSRLVMKFGGTSVGDVERIGRVARIVAAERKPGRGLGGGGFRHVGRDGSAGEACARGRRRERPQQRPGRGEFDDEYDVVVSSGEQVTTGLLALALRRSACRRARGRTGRSRSAPTRAHARARIDSIDGRQNRRRHRQRRSRGGARLSRHQPRWARDHAGARRLGYVGGGAGGSARRGALRHLHRRRRRLHHRPAHRFEGAAAGEDLLRRNAGDGLARAPRCCRRDRSSWRLRRTCGCACCRVLSNRARPIPAPSCAMRMRSWKSKSSQASPIRATRPRSRSSASRIIPASPRTSSRARREQHQRRHDRAERSAPDRAAEHRVHLPRPRRRARGRIDRGAKDKIGVEEIHIRRDVAKVSVIGIGMKSQVGVAKTMFTALAKRASTSRRSPLPRSKSQC